MDNIAKALNELMNAKKAGKNSYIACPVSDLLLRILAIMKKQGYIDYKADKSGKFDNAVIEIKKLNECKIIKPRFYVGIKSLDRYIKRYLPSRDLGVVIVSTNKGLMTHKEAIEKGLGGSLIAYCY